MIQRRPCKRIAMRTLSYGSTCAFSRSRSILRGRNRRGLSPCVRQIETEIAVRRKSSFRRHSGRDREAFLPMSSNSLLACRNVPNDQSKGRPDVLCVYSLFGIRHEDSGGNGPYRGQFSVRSRRRFFESKVRPLLVARCYSCQADSEMGGFAPRFAGVSHPRRKPRSDGCPRRILFEPPNGRSAAGSRRATNAANRGAARV